MNLGRPKWREDWRELYMVPRSINNVPKFLIITKNNSDKGKGYFYQTINQKVSINIWSAYKSFKAVIYFPNYTQRIIHDDKALTVKDVALIDLHKFFSAMWLPRTYKELMNNLCS